MLLHFNKVKGDIGIVVMFIYCCIFFTALFFDAFLSTHYRHIYITLYTTLEYVTFALLIGAIITSKRAITIIFLLSGLFIVFQLIYFYTAKFKPIDSLPIGIESLLIFSYIVFFFFEQLQKPKSEYIYNDPWFWAVIGILIYLSCSFFFNIIAAYDRKSIIDYWFLTYVFETIKNICFAITAYLIIRMPTKSIKGKQPPIPHLDLI